MDRTSALSRNHGTAAARVPAPTLSRKLKVATFILHRDTTTGWAEDQGRRSRPATGRTMNDGTRSRLTLLGLLALFAVGPVGFYFDLPMLYVIGSIGTLAVAAAVVVYAIVGRGRRRGDAAARSREAHQPILVKSVGAAVQSIHGGGRLSVWPGRIHLEFGRVTGALAGVPDIEHTQSSVRIVCARIMFPWMNMTVLLRDRERTAAVRGSCLARRSLTAAFEEAGFSVETERTWIRIGVLDTSG
jgi:hypothetical protein